MGKKEFTLALVFRWFANFEKVYCHPVPVPEDFYPFYFLVQGFLSFSKFVNTGDKSFLKLWIVATLVCLNQYLRVLANWLLHFKIKVEFDFLLIKMTVQAAFFRFCWYIKLFWRNFSNNIVAFVCFSFLRCPIFFPLFARRLLFSNYSSFVIHLPNAFWYTQLYMFKQRLTWSRAFCMFILVSFFHF